ncbi:MAG: hypothetical protein HHJ12_00085 [Glaciimonas sp.]|nr:hypothetical protein [Glaciimonas sp.]
MPIPSLRWGNAQAQRVEIGGAGSAPCRTRGRPEIALRRPRDSLGKSIGMADKVFEGVCADLPPLRKK